VCHVLFDFVFGSIVTFMMFGVSMEFVTPLSVVTIDDTVVTKPIIVDSVPKFVIDRLRWGWWSLVWWNRSHRGCSGGHRRFIHRLCLVPWCPLSPI